MIPFTEIEGDTGTGLLLIADHASSAVPDGIDLGVPDPVMREHVALDIGVAPLAAALCDHLGCPAILGGVSRLVVDLNREEEADGLIPPVSDGRIIPGNEALDDLARAERLALWRTYHARVAELIGTYRPKLLISLHSFTPKLMTSDFARPWQIGILYNRDERAARSAIPLLEAAHVVTGDNLPYSGKMLNATMNRHGEASGTPYLGIEVRQDLISNKRGVVRWAATLAPVLDAVAAEF